MPSMVLVGDLGEPLGASWGLRRASNGLEHARRDEPFANSLTETNGYATMAPRGAPLAEESLLTTQGTCGRLSAAPGARAGACGGLHGCKRAPPNRSSSGSFPSNRAGGIKGWGWLPRGL